ncbi:hypothetical protein [Blastomonas sp.]|uniref:hypothetical protein n=1 Tax=Blastomonas sp. TaxID=1909299 RepID=UPI00406A0EA6
MTGKTTLALTLLGALMLSPVPSLAPAAAKPSVTKSVVNGVTVWRSPSPTTPGAVQCSTAVTLANSSGGAAPKLTMTYYRAANGNGQVELQIPSPWVADRPELTLAIGNSSVSGPVDLRGKAEGYVSFTRPRNAFNTVRAGQGTATISFDGKSFSWTAPSFDTVLQALEQCQP